VAVLEAAGGRVVKSYSQQDAVVAVAFNQDGKLLATGSVDNTARVIDAATGKELFRFNHLDWVYAVAFSQDGRYLATASKDKTVLIMEQGTGKRLSRIAHEDPVIAVMFSKDGNILQSFSGDTFSRHFVRPQDLIDEACARLSRNLTPEEWNQFFPEVPYHKTCPNLPDQ
jgi:WD40 repeat protein